jgi:hypothetical protein
MPNYLAIGTVETSSIAGLQVGDEFRTELMLDPGLQLTEIDPGVFRVVDPWILHVHRFVSPIAWLNGFTLEVPREPFPGPDPPPWDVLRVIAVYDNEIPDGGDPNMPDEVMIDEIPVGSQIVLNLEYPDGTLFPAGATAPPILPDALSPFPVGGQLMILDPQGETLASGVVNRVVPEPVSSGLLFIAALGGMLARRRRIG